MNKPYILIKSYETLWTAAFGGDDERHVVYAKVVEDPKHDFIKQEEITKREFYDLIAYDNLVLLHKDSDGEVYGDPSEDFKLRNEGIFARTGKKEVPLVQKGHYNQQSSNKKKMQYERIDY